MHHNHKQSQPVRSHSRKLLPTTHSHPPTQTNTTTLKPSKKSSNNHHLIRQYSLKKKMPRIINELQKNVKQLKKCYQDHYISGRNVGGDKCKGSLQRMRSQTKVGSEQNCSVVTQEIDGIRKSYASIYGRNTSNLVQLYNFYKKGIEKSTGILGSLSMSNKAHSLSITANHPPQPLSKSRSKAPSPLQQQDLQSQQPATNKQKPQKTSTRKHPFDHQRKSTTLVNPFLENAGVSMNFSRDVSQKHIRKPKKQLINVNSLLDGYQSIEQSNSKTFYKKPDQKIRNMPQTNDKLRNQQRGSFKENIRGENIPKNSQAMSFKLEKYTDQLKPGAQAVKKVLKFEETSQNSNENEDKYRALFNFARNQTNQKAKQNTAQVINIQKTPFQDNIRSHKKSSPQKKSSNKKSSNKKSSNKMNANQKSSSKKSPTMMLNQAVFLDSEDLTRKDSSIVKGFQGSKYYVKPVPFRKKLQDSLDGLEITIKENSRCPDLDFIPLDI